MLQVTTELPLEAVESVLRRAAQKNEASLIASTHVGQHLPDAGPGRDAFVYSICQAELYGALLDAEIRAAAFLPWRIAAYVREGRVVLECMSPLELCRVLSRPDLAPFAATLETALERILEEAARPQAAHAVAAGPRRGSLGATEDQVNQRGMVPQRIDCRGTKVEDLGGTGEPDTKGG
jgi:hypothetical protein